MRRKGERVGRKEGWRERRWNMEEKRISGRKALVWTAGGRFAERKSYRRKNEE